MRKLIRKWFRGTNGSYSAFMRTLLSGSIEDMQEYMEQVLEVTFSSFDTGSGTKESRMTHLEFKVFDPKKEQTIEEAAHRALQQIEDKKYETALRAKGIKNVRKYGFAFNGREALIME